MTQLQEQLSKIFPTLPDDIKSLLLAEDFNDRIEVITAKYSLDEVDSGIMIRIVVRLLSGIIAPSEFVSAIIENIDIEKAQATLLAQEINRDIFNPVKEALKQLHNVGVGKDSEVKTVSPTPSITETVNTNQSNTLQVSQKKEAVVTQVFEPVKARPVQISTPQPVVPPKNTEDPKPAIPFGAIPEEKPEVNNLESKLGGAFTIKKEVMYTAQSTPTPPIQPVSPSTQAAKPGVQPPQPTTPAPQVKTADPYRELPS